MKKIVKVSAIVLALVMAMGSLCACGKGTSTDNPSATEKLVMATNASFPPYEYVDDNGAFAGIDVEIAGLIAEKLGLTLEIQDVDFGSIIGGVQTGKFDIGMAGMTVTEERLQNVNFSTSYAKGVQVIIVPEDSEIQSFDDLAAKEDVIIGVQQNTTGHIYMSDDLGEDHIIKYNTGNDAVQALVTGKVDAVVIDNEPAKSYVAANEGLKILETAYKTEDYAICVAKENTALLENINAALAELTADGSIDAIIAKYISA